MSQPLPPEDYTEPRCPLSTSQYKEKGYIAQIPVDRVIEKLDYYVGRRDTVSAERHLLYWLTEAEANGDTHGRLTVINELMGLYRNTERKDEAYKYVSLGLSAVEAGGYDGKLVSATTYINAATVYKTFCESDRAIPLFRRAREIYEALLPKDDERLGGLYNNMALALSDLRLFTEAYELYLRAIDIMKKTERGGIEAAISYLNMANAVEADLGLEDGAETIDEHLGCAAELLDADSHRSDPYYAYVCTRCAPTFLRYGHFVYAEELRERARRIYERD